MSKDIPKDPGEALRRLLNQWERGFEEIAGRFMGEAECERSKAQLDELQSRARKTFGEFMAQNLAAADMPTRDDLVQLTEAVAALDERLARVEAMLANKAPERDT